MGEFLKYPKIYHLGHEDTELVLADKNDTVVEEEKIDGANFRFYVRDNKLILGSHTQELAEVPDKFWKRGVEYTKEKFDGRNLQNYDGYIFYAEMCVKHSVDYDWDKIPPILGFDIMYAETGQFMDWKEAKRIYESLGITFVPVIQECKVSELGELSEKRIPKSAYSATQAEGVVIKNYAKNVMCKIVSSKFKEVNRAAFGMTKSQARATQDNDEMVTAAYATNSRIDKAIFRLIEQGEKLDMTMMHKLPNAVVQDMYEENWREILNSNYTIDLRNIRRLVAARCVMVLKQVIINNMLNK